MILLTLFFNLNADGMFCAHVFGRKETAVGFSHIAQKENVLAEIFSSQGISPHIDIFKNIFERNDTFIKSIEKLSLNKMQRKAIKSALENNVSIISGGAEKGKTYTINLISICMLENIHVIIAAPTGKAASKIEEVTNIKASTLHRLMGYNGRHFKHEKNNSFEIKADILIIDEVSMVDVELFCHLFQSINLMKTSLILVGDHNQLPPVDPGNVLRDLMAAQPIVITILDKVIR